MAETVNFDIGNLRFWRGHPALLPATFPEIQELRTKHYTREFGRAGRSEAEIAHYIGRLTNESFNSPQKAVGKTARSGQVRLSAVATAAFDEGNGELRALMHGARNVSSKYEPKLNELHVPKLITSRIGNYERARKLDGKQEYVWGSECVYDEDRSGLTETLFALQLEAYDPSLRGTFYPWTEEDRLRLDLTGLGYRWDGNKPRPLLGDKGFGEGSKPTYRSRWVVPSIEQVISCIGNISGAEDALSQAHERLTVEFIEH